MRSASYFISAEKFIREHDSYLVFLSDIATLMEGGGSSDTQLMINLKNFNTLSESKQGETLYAVINSSQVSHTEVIKLAKQLNFKEMVWKHIQALPKSESILKSYEAITLKSRLGLFFHTSRDGAATDFQHGLLKQIYTAVVTNYNSASPMDIPARLRQTFLFSALPTLSAGQVQTPRVQLTRDNIVDLQFFKKLLAAHCAEPQYLLELLSNKIFNSTNIYAVYALMPRDDHEKIYDFIADYFNILNFLLTSINTPAVAEKILNLVTAMMACIKDEWLFTSNYFTDAQYPRRLYGEYLDLVRLLKAKKLIVRDTNNNVNVKEFYYDSSFNKIPFEIKTKHMFSLQLTAEDARIVFNLLVLGRVAHEPLQKYKESVYQYLLALPDGHEKLAIVESTLNSNSELGKYFEIGTQPRWRAKLDKVLQNMRDEMQRKSKTGFASIPVSVSPALSANSYQKMLASMTVAPSLYLEPVGTTRSMIVATENEKLAAYELPKYLATIKSPVHSERPCKPEAKTHSSSQRKEKSSLVLS